QHSGRGHLDVPLVVDNLGKPDINLPGASSHYPKCLLLQCND
ncbi:hypothetical protein Tco_1271225, partial [Tanacetum coccineum]